MQRPVPTAQPPLPLGTAVLSHVALSLLTWNVVLRAAAFLIRGLSRASP
jgi:hypothetical protein